MLQTRTAIVALLGCALVVGCRFQQIDKPRLARGSGNEPLARTSGEKPTVHELPVTRKQVSGKDGPSTLIALDGTRCQVNEKRYQETAVGELVWCDWRDAR